MHIITKAEKLNIAVMDALARPLSISNNFFPLSMLRIFQPLGEIRT
jgi:hypothetical protein